jgi:hypothetical protein
MEDFRVQSREPLRLLNNTTSFGPLEDPMREAPVLFMFEVEARAETPERQIAGRNAVQGGPIVDPRDVARQLNEDAAAICDKLEREVRKLFPPYVNVQADVHFEPGSLLMTGTIAVLSWVGNAVLDALKEQAEEQLSALVKMAMQRVMNRTMAAAGLTQSVGPMEMTVRPVRFPSLAPSAPQQQAPTVPSAPPGPSAGVNSLRPQPVTWLGWAVAVVFLLQVLLVLDRLLVVQLR